MSSFQTRSGQIKRSGTPRFGMEHLNNDLMCVIDCETTGKRPGIHDIFEVCILPLDAQLKPVKHITPFACHLKLRRPDSVDPEVYKKNKTRICDAQIRGLDPDFAADLFEEWFQNLGLTPGKMIVPLAHNWPHDRGFIIDWLGWETFEQRFSPMYRDAMTAALFVNDSADHHNERIPFPHVRLQYLAKLLSVPNDSPHEAISDCVATAAVYHKMCRAYQLQLIAAPDPDSTPAPGGPEALGK
jgi:DNA polymerase III alpha subunit (gram-positive type)